MRKLELIDVIYTDLLLNCFNVHVFRRVTITKRANYCRGVGGQLEELKIQVDLHKKPLLES